MIPNADFDAMAATCAPTVAPSTLRAMATVESGLNPYAVGVVGGRLIRQPTALGEAISTVNALQRNGIKFSAGLVQIYVRNWPAYQLDAQTVFEPCHNMRAAAGILSDCYARATRSHDGTQIALRKALSCYYSNNFVTGFNHGYVQKVVAVAIRIGAQNPKHARPGDSST